MTKVIRLFRRVVNRGRSEIDTAIGTCAAPSDIRHSAKVFLYALSVRLRSSLASVLHQPGILLVEILWRWFFGFSALILAVFAAVRLERAIGLNAEEEEMLASRSPILIAQGILEIAHRARPIAVRLGIIVIPAILLLWVLAATLGRGYVLRRLPSRESVGPRWLALSALNFLRVVTLLLLIVAYLGCSFATSLVIDPYEPNYALGVLVFLSLFVIALASWSLVHWIISTACLYAARQNLETLGALSATMRLLRENFRELFSISAQNSSVRTVVAIVFTLLALPPLLLYRMPLLFWTIEVTLFLAYCAVSDLLLLARLVAYVEVTEHAPAVVVAEHS